MRFTTSEAAHVTGGRAHGHETTFAGATIDSRHVAPGQLFVPIVAERNGHEFIEAARIAGATAYLTSIPPGAGSSIEVDDTTVALTALGAASRDRLKGHVIGITGSVGKTSTKDLLASVLRATGAVAHASEKSFNNELGVPLTLLDSPEDSAAVVVEMGARGLGHIAELCRIARPTIGVVTMVGAVHTSEFGDVESVALAKSELVAAVPPSGHVVLNADNPPVAAMVHESKAPTFTYGLVSPADVFAEDISLDDELRPSFRLIVPGGSAPVKMTARGAHSVINALAAAAVAHLLNVPVGDIALGLATARMSPWRMEMVPGMNGSALINDAYNANPMSMAAALRALAQLDRPRRVAVLGVMAELGAVHDAEHAAVVALADELGIEVISFQEPAYGVRTVESIRDAAVALGPLSAADAVLVKGSRVAGLERLVELLADP